VRNGDVGDADALNAVAGKVLGIDLSDVTL